MTVQEAHEYLEDFQRIMTQHREAYSKKLIEANGQAILALEKQIPKKPIGIYDENIYHIDDDDYIYEPALFGICPVCNKEVQDGMLFCSFCGQALDWSDTE